MQVVKFLKPHTPYKQNDIAGVTDEAFVQLAKDGIVEAFQQEETEEPEQKPEEKSVDDPEQNKMIKQAPVKK
jgi:hypothetical protein